VGRCCSILLEAEVLVDAAKPGTDGAVFSSGVTCAVVSLGVVRSPFFLVELEEREDGDVIRSPILNVLVELEEEEDGVARGFRVCPAIRLEEDSRPIRRGVFSRETNIRLDESRSKFVVEIIGAVEALLEGASRRPILFGVFFPRFGESFGRFHPSSYPLGSFFPCHSFRRIMSP